MLLIWTVCFVVGAEETPEPYAKDEFPDWLRTVRRAEIILIGAIPFSLFLSFEVYDVYRFLSRNMDPRYSPWPFGASGGAPYTQEEQIGIAVSTLAFSSIIALADFLLGVPGGRQQSQP